MVRVSASRLALLAEYAPTPTLAFAAAMETRFTMDPLPLSTMPLPKVCAQRNAPTTLTSMTSRKSANVTSSSLEKPSDAGVVHQHVERSHIVGHRSERRLVTYVAAHDARAPAGVQPDHVVPIALETLGDGAADAAYRSCDHGP